MVLQLKDLNAKGHFFFFALPNFDRNNIYQFFPFYLNFFRNSFFKGSPLISIHHSAPLPVNLESRSSDSEFIPAVEMLHSDPDL